MKHIQFVIFFSVFFGIHLLVNFYIYKRAAQGIEAWPNMIWTLRALMIFLTLSYPLGRYLEKVWYSPLPNIIHWIGAFWFAGMLYFTLSIFLLDIIRWTNMLFHFLPSKLFVDYKNTKLISTYITIGVVFLVVLAGFINAWTPKIVHKTIEINKNGRNLKNIRVVAASDIHLGTIIGPRKTGKLVKTINSLHPDIILFAGDVVDEDVKPVIEQNLGKNLMNLKAPYGVYAVTGNHEYIGGVEEAVKYLQEHGISILRDSSILVNNSFYVVGREDKDKNRHSIQKRKEVNELVDSLDHSLPIILLDHQPYNLEKAEKAGVDLQISGHTHDGQLWPFGYITRKIFEVSKGYKKKGNTNFYVSTGYGTWGPPVRLGNRPEILDFELVFK